MPLWRRTWIRDGQRRGTVEQVTLEDVLLHVHDYNLPHSTILASNAIVLGGRRYVATAEAATVRGWSDMSNAWRRLHGCPRCDVQCSTACPLG